LVRGLRRVQTGVAHPLRGWCLQRVGLLTLILLSIRLGNHNHKSQINYRRIWSGRKDLPALSLPKGTFDLLVPNQMPALVEVC
jgi:hypothetical protein